MKRLLLTLIILSLSVYLGLMIKADPGYALFTYRHLSVEMPLWLAGLLFIASFFIIYHLLNFLNYLLSLSFRYRLWSGRRKLRKSQTQTSRGLIELSEGHWKKAENYLMRSANSSETPLINYLSAARAAQEQGAYERRDNYLRLGHESTPGAEIAVGLTQAELQLKHGQLEQALASLRHLQTLVPEHKYVLKLLHKLYLKLNDWENLLNLLPAMQRRTIIKADESFELTKKAYQEILLKDLKQQQFKKLKNLWQQMPSTMQDDQELFAIYLQALIENKEDKKVEGLLRERLQRGWHKDLVRLYGLVNGAEPEKQLAHAEAWLKQHPEDADLLLCVGRLSLKNKLWGKAKTYLENAVAINHNAESYAELGKLYEQLENTDEAFNCYREGLSQLTREKKC